MSLIAWVLMAGSATTMLYTFVCYPLLLWVWARVPVGDSSPPDPGTWPKISVTIPAYNEARQIRETVESLLATDYPADRRQVLVVSDASNDGTDEIVAGYVDRGVELVRMPERVGKTAAENAARARLTGEIVVNTDASIRIDPPAVKALVRQFADPTIGVASGRDVSVSHAGQDVNTAESGYVGYEMWLRGLETRVGGIVGASGSFYAIRRPLHEQPLPAGLSRDFASALIAREHGYRAVSVNEALAVVPRTGSLRSEYRRKVRTIARGIRTLYFKKHLLNPFRYGRFAFMLFSHKVCRWLVPWAAVAGLVGLVLLGVSATWVRVPVGLGLLALSLAVVGWVWPEKRPMPRLIALPTFAIAANVAAMAAVFRAARGELDSVWEPTRREAAASAPAQDQGGG